MSIEDFNQKTFILKVRSFMRANKLSVRKFAKISKIPEGTIFRAFYQKNALKIETVKKFQKAMIRFKKDDIS